MLSSLQLFITLMIGILIGFTFAQFLRTTNCSDFVVYGLARQANGKSYDSSRTTSSSQFETGFSALELALNNNNNDMQQVTARHDDHLPKIRNNVSISQLVGRIEIDHSIAEHLYRDVRVLCWILTSPSNHAKRAIHVKQTWGKRCNKLLFISSMEDSDLRTVKLAVGEGRSNLWHKTREAARYIYEKHFHEADWFLKADDDTYVIMENLRIFLYPYSTNEPVYFGCKFKPHVRQGYMSGGAGYVLSRESLRRFAEEAYSNGTICRQTPGGSEDLEMGLCLQNVNVVAGDSRDRLKRGRFFPSTPTGHIIPKERHHWYWRYIYYDTKDGEDCCSNYAISFHYIQPNYMYVMDYLIYRLSPYGLQTKILSLPKRLNTTEWIDIWRKQQSNNPRA